MNPLLEPRFAMMAGALLVIVAYLIVANSSANLRVWSVGFFLIAAGWLAASVVLLRRMRLSQRR